MTSGKMISMLVIGVAMLLAACGGGGDGGGGTSPVAAPLNGVFIDSVVQGIGFNAAPSGLSGLTNAAGFNYRDGDMITLNIGGRMIGNPVKAAPVITVLEVFGATSLADPRVVNLAQLLLTLGGNPAGQNPIQLSAAIPAGLPNPLNFSDPNFDTVMQAALQSAGLTLVANADATTHLQSSFSTVSVTVAGAGSGSVTSNPSGIGCSSATCSAVFIDGNSVTLTAVGAGFAGWIQGTGDAAGCAGTGPCTFTVRNESSVTATFNVPPPSTLTISNVGTGIGTVNCSVNSGVFAPCAGPYANGTPIVLQATANPGSTFTGWTSVPGDAVHCNGTKVDCSMTLTTATAVTANFVVQTASFTLSTAMASASGNGGGGISITCSAAGAGGPFAPCALSYNAGTNLWLQATPNSVSNFTGWSTGSGNGPGSPSACNGTSGICNFSVTEVSSITANFNRPTLTATIVGAGSVSSGPTGITNCATNCTAVFDKNTPITLTASGNGFAGFSGGCTSGTTTCGPFPLNADTTVTATFNLVSQVLNFKFIGAPGQKLLAVNPASPGTPTPVKVGGVDVILPSTPGFRGAGAGLVTSGTYVNATTTSFQNIAQNTMVFASGGKFYRASTKVSDGVPGVGGNEPVQVSSASTGNACGGGSVFDPTNTNPIVGFSDAGPDNTCDTNDDFIVLMHLNDLSTTAPVQIPAGISINTGGSSEVYDLTSGSLLHTLVVSPTGALQYMGDDRVPQTVTNGATFGGAPTIVARQLGKVFVANATKLFIYDPVTHALNTTPVAQADAGKQWVQDQDGRVEAPADSTAIYLVQNNGDVFRVPLTTAPGSSIAAKHFTGSTAGITNVQQVDQTLNRIILLTGTRPFGNNGVADPCVAANTCNNGIIAVSKITASQFVEIEAAVAAKQVNNPMSFNNYVLYTASVPNVSGGAFARDENATNPRIDRQGNWSGGILNNIFNVVSNQQSVLRAILVQQSLCQPQCIANGTTVKAFDLPTTVTPRELGTVSDPANLLQFAPFFREAFNDAMIGTANLAANPLLNQPFFVDTTVPNSLAKVTTPASAQWDEVSD